MDSFIFFKKQTQEAQLCCGSMSQLIPLHIAYLLFSSSIEDQCFLPQRCTGLQFAPLAHSRKVAGSLPGTCHCGVLHVL